MIECHIKCGEPSYSIEKIEADSLIQRFQDSRDLRLVDKTILITLVLS